MSAIQDLAGRVAIVTGGGGGVGGAIAVELARRGAAVVVNDLAVNVTGTGRGDTHADVAVQRITEAGGTAVADSSSVADQVAVESMVTRAVDRFGRVDILVGAAGIVSAGTLDQTDQEAWDRLLAVHVGGHLNCIRAVLPVMAGRGYGRILNVTSGAGLQRVAAATAAYGTAKRAIAALTWALGRQPPAGVTINALSPIAATRMVARPGGAPPEPAPPAAGRPDAPSSPLDLGHMPPAEALAPVVAYLCGERTAWLSGQVIFTNGVEASVIAAPRLIESVHRSAWLAEGVTIGAALGDLVVPTARAGVTTGGSMPRLAVGARASSRGTAAAGGRGTAGGRVCLVVSAAGPPAAALGAALSAQGWRVAGVGPWEAPDGRLAETVTAGFDGAERLLAAARERLGRVDAIVVHSGAEGPGPTPPVDQAGGPSSLLAPGSEASILDRIRLHAAWSRAAARADVAGPGRPEGLVAVHAVASSLPGAVVAQAVGQMLRCLQSDRDPGRLRCFAVEVVPSGQPAPPALADLLTWLCGSPDAAGLAAEELTTGDEWIGLRSHPAAAATVSFGTPVPEAWLDQALQAVVAGHPAKMRSSPLGRLEILATLDEHRGTWPDARS